MNETKITTRWETSGRGDVRRLVREYWQGNRVVRFEVIRNTAVSVIDLPTLAFIQSMRASVRAGISKTTTHKEHNPKWNT